MSTEENKSIARRWNEEIWNKGNLASIDDLFTEDFVFNYPPSGAAPDREGYKQFITTNFDTWADIHCNIDDMIAEEDKVAVRWTWRGTHKGEFVLMETAPTGKQVTMTGISVIHIVDGKIVEEWTEQDMLGMMQQLGIFTQSDS